MSELNLIMLGPPGAGKGTQALRLREDLRLPYIPAGDMLREAVSEGTDLGRLAKEHMEEGNLVPDDVVIGAILERCEAADCRDGFVLDGFPRTIPQAEALESALDDLGRKVTAVLLVEAPDEVVVKRISGRRICKNGHVYHLETDPPARPDRCDHDDLPLTQREDDRPEKVRRRLQVYHDQTTPLIEYYDERGLLRRFDGTRDPDEVQDHIRATLSTIRLEERL